MMCVRQQATGLSSLAIFLNTITSLSLKNSFKHSFLLICLFLCLTSTANSQALPFTNADGIVQAGFVPLKSEYQTKRPQKPLNGDVIIPNLEIANDGNELKTYIIFFSSKSCIPCKLMRPVVDDLSKIIRVYEYDVDVDEATAGKMDVHSLPTLMVMSGGKVSKKFEGRVSLDEIKAVLPVVQPVIVAKKIKYNIFGLE